MVNTESSLTVIVDVRRAGRVGSPVRTKANGGECCQFYADVLYRQALIIYKFVL